MAVAQPCIEKIYISLNAPVAFNLRQKLLGDQNANLQYIINETKANVSLRGRGSGFIEPSTGVESNEPMHLYIEHPVMKSLIEAKSLARNLLETVQQEIQVFMQTNQSNQNVPIQQPPPIMQATSNQSITIPSAILSVPPPNILQNNTIQPTHIIQQPNFIQQSQIIPQSMQIIQQTPINIPPPTGVNIPTLRTATPISLQFQGQPNIQIQQAAQQILLNQGPAQQYQLQYIPASSIGNTHQGQTIQHFIQPQHQIQGIIQPNAQQFITLQGNTAFMLPPPNIMHNPQAIGAVFNAPSITINPDELAKNDGAKTKGEETKSIATPQQIATTSRTIINQPPPPIQQFLVNTNAWPQNQQMPIQILAQPQQAIRSGNEILIQNAVPTAQGQVLAAFSPQQGASIQQIQFSNQPLITQPPPIQVQNIQSIETQQPIAQTSLTTAIRPQSSLSYQQHFEQKLTGDNPRRTLKRKVNEPEEDLTKSFPKAGVGALTKSRPPPPIHPNQQMIKITSNNRMIAKPNVNTSNTSADNIAIINSKNNSNKIIFTKSNSTASVATKSIVSQADATSPKLSTTKNENEFIELPTSSAAVTQQAFEIQNQFMQPPPNIQFNQPRGIPQQIMMYQTQMPPPAIQQQQQELSVLQNNNNNFVQQLNINRFNVPRGMILQMNTINDNSAALAGNATFSQQGQPRFRQQW